MNKTLQIFTFIISLFFNINFNAYAENISGGAKNINITLNIIDKIHGNSDKIMIKSGGIAKINNLIISAKRCWTRHRKTHYFPEYAALIEVFEDTQPPNRLFLGWLFSASPSLSYMKSVTYDIKVLKCEVVKEK